ncbi:MAG TPA: hypothetical protein VH590_09580, partial [Ktedonobacterales bacterium]
MSANVNETLSSAEDPSEDQAEVHLGLPSAPSLRGSLQRLGHQAFSRFVAAGPWGALAHRDFRLLWSGLLISQAGSQMRVVAVTWQVFLLSGSAFQIGALGLFQAIPT